MDWTSKSMKKQLPCDTCCGRLALQGIRLGGKCQSWKVPYCLISFRKHFLNDTGDGKGSVGGQGTGTRDGSRGCALFLHWNLSTKRNLFTSGMTLPWTLRTPPYTHTNTCENEKMPNTVYVVQWLKLPQESMPLHLLAKNKWSSQCQNPRFDSFLLLNKTTPLGKGG